MRRLSAATLALFAIAPLAALSLYAQQAPPQPVDSPDTHVVGDDTPDVRSKNGSPTEQAWALLDESVHDMKHVDRRIQALGALNIINHVPRAATLISARMDDPELDVRTAAALAAGPTGTPPAAVYPGNKMLTTDLRRLLDDKEPQVAFAAATTLWKMGDRSGEDILVAIVDGERSANPTIIHGTRHSMSRTLHSPSALAKIGLMQGAPLLLGPFGFGIGAYEYMAKNGGDNARVLAIEAISTEHLTPIRDELLAALKDKDPAVRAAAAKALSSYHEVNVQREIATLFDDGKEPVRLTAAAAYLRASGSTGTKAPAAK